MLSRKLFVLAAALFAVCLIGQTSAEAQSKQSKVLYAEPSRLYLVGDYKTVAEEENGNMIKEKFYPIGWSKTGAFAYFVEPADEACGCYFADLIIQDLRTDKVLWKHEYRGEESGKETLKSHWAKNRKEFSRKLAQFGIRAQQKFDLQNAFDYQKDRLTAEVKEKPNVRDVFAVAGNLIVRLTSKERGAKTIYEYKFDPKKYEAFLDAELAGGLLSPFEPRAAVVMIETYRGYEGPPNITRITIVGASLTSGFQ